MIKKVSIIIVFSLLSLCFTGLIFVLWFQTSHHTRKSSEVKTHSSNPADLNFFETAYSFKKKEIDLLQNDVSAGVIPHHLLAADLIAEFFHNLEGENYDTVILIGPNHFNSGDAKMIVSTYDWKTPYGRLEIDNDILSKISGDDMQIDEEAIKNEHSITSEVSFIKKTFPQAKFLPIILKPTVGHEEAADLAKKLFELGKDKKILLIASVDFSHYKDSKSAQKNDQESISVIKTLAFDKIYDLDLDSPATIHALLKFSQLSGAKFELLNNSNSAILAGKPDIESTTSYITGYFIK